jgi:hypothetical protein
MLPIEIVLFYSLASYASQMYCIKPLMHIKDLNEEWNLA